MISSFERNVISLIATALDGRELKINNDADFEKIYKFSQSMQIVPLIYYGAEGIDGFFDTQAGKQFFQSFIRYSFQSENQVSEIAHLTNEFDKEKINYMKLKGTVLKVLYPHPEMRLMGDADILIDEKQYDTVKKIMKKTGYTEGKESDHELFWTKDNIVIELHKRLIPSYNKDYYAYFGDGWRLAIRKNDTTNEYCMSDEDCFIYLLAHFAKHYRDAGIGVKHITDFYVYLNKYPALDFEYIEKELDKLQLLAFWKNIKKLLDVWFNGDESNDISEFLTHKIFESGTFGTYETSVLSGALKISKTTKHIKFKRIFLKIFLPYKTMKNVYPCLKKFPILLPFMWVRRLISIIFFRRESISRERHSLNMINDENVSQYQRELNFVGLDFNFK